MLLTIVTMHQKFIINSIKIYVQALPKHYSDGPDHTLLDYSVLGSGFANYTLGLPVSGHMVILSSPVSKQVIIIIIIEQLWPCMQLSFPCLNHIFTSLVLLSQPLASSSHSLLRYFVLLIIKV